jgi:hypothetical protein
MRSLDCMPAVRTPEAFQSTRQWRTLEFCLPHRETRSATSTEIDFGAISSVHFRSGLQPPCLRFAVTVAGHHARLGTQLLAMLYYGRHLRRLNLMRLQGATPTPPGIRITYQGDSVEIIV